MKLYVSGPMTDVPYYNFPRFREVAAVLRERGHEVVSPHELDEDSGFVPDPEGRPLPPEQYEEFLSRDENEIRDGGFDGIVFIEGWADSNGAIREGKRMLEAGGVLFTYTPEYDYGILPLPTWAFEYCASVYEGALSWSSAY